jgi:enoyl-CoA hydratase
VIEQQGLDERSALENELLHGRAALPQAQAGLERFRGGAGRHGAFPMLKTD